MWILYGVSEAGNKHRIASVPNQDHFRIQKEGDNIICVVSDGAWSCAYAEEAAAFAVDFSVDFLRKRIEERFNFSDATMFAQMLDDMLVAMQEETRDIAKQKGRDYDDYGATLHALVAGNDFIAYMHVGDGVLVYRNDQGKDRDPAKDGYYHLPCIPIKGEYDNETVFFNCDDDARQSAKTFYLPYTPSFFSLATDGLEKASLLGRKENWKPHSPFFVYLSSLLDTDDPEKALREFLLNELIEKRTSDDRTVVFAKWDALDK
jgi:hypothetical protein